jgi:hypothetical protein
LSGTIVKFDKLHSSLTTKEHPPFIADLMPSRWAYEALAVSQFVDNQYEKHYYDIDKIDSELAYKLNFLIPELTSLLDEWRTIQITDNDLDRITAISKTISNSMIHSLEDIPNIETKVMEIENLPINQRIRKYQNLLDFTRLFYSEYLDKILYKRDMITQQLVEQYSYQGYIDLKNENYNEAIANMVLKFDDSEKLFIKDQQIIKRYEPVFSTPDNVCGRAQFYSPVKNVGNTYYFTLYFNALIIWIISAFIYMALVADIINKLSLNTFNQYIKRLKGNESNKA